MKFNVTIQRTEYREHVFEVEADSPEEAVEKAEEESCDYNFYNSPISSATEEVIAVKDIS